MLIINTRPDEILIDADRFSQTVEMPLAATKGRKNALDRLVGSRDGTGAANGTSLTLKTSNAAALLSLTVRRRRAPSLSGPSGHESEGGADTLTHPPNSMLALLLLLFVLTLKPRVE